MRKNKEAALESLRAEVAAMRLIDLSTDKGFSEYSLLVGEQTRPVHEQFDRLQAESMVRGLTILVRSGLSR
jgi:hypothetical protein